MRPGREQSACQMAKAAPTLENGAFLLFSTAYGRGERLVFKRGRKSFACCRLGGVDPGLSGLIEADESLGGLRVGQPEGAPGVRARPPAYVFDVGPPAQPDRPGA